MPPTPHRRPRPRAAQLSALPTALMLLALSASSATADVLHLRNGRELEGRIVHESKSTVRIVMAGGTVAIPRDHIARIERLPDRRGRITLLLETIDRDDPAALRAVAARARELSLDDEARDLEALAADLSLRQAIAALGESPSADALLRLERNLPDKAAPVSVRIVLVRKALARAKAENEAGDQRLATARLGVLIGLRMKAEADEARAARREPAPVLRAEEPKPKPQRVAKRRPREPESSKAEERDDAVHVARRQAEARAKAAELAELKRLRRRFEAELKARRAEQLRCQRLTRRRQAAARRRARRRR